ncbi:unnamed protein product [[Actinomadura] parvosata subsp. kistnae]|uniref:Uncharacterized protein n=1 Tax=[Actinomadura] parvosata subsp. kistnae TaxID=1909395 RepID=A0A1V0AF66_9ACTN|nr:hypothetical protein [Nonomuraea sp. ATCC 55076]AQZ68732.1 hypothetical protein BKM31_51130 [Nonomuraea sp. ATCC 55076]SPL92775.1 unnamed protein product [Actinomadura parvosata subsp. kistnae]
MRLLVAFATAAATVPLSVVPLGAASLSVPAEAASAVYGFAWADGKGHLRIVPKSASRATRRTFAFKALPKAKELRLDYTKAAYGRVTTACDLKETEGRVAVDAKGLGRTKCTPAHLADELGSGPVPVRVEHAGGKATKVNEVLVASWGSPRTATGTIKRAGDTSVLLTTGGKQIKLGYAYTTAFYRTTARCGDAWLAGKPVNADRNGLGKKMCTWQDLTKALKGAAHPVLVKVDYTPGVDALNEVWEVYGDA